MTSYNLITRVAIALSFALAANGASAQTIAISGGKVYPVSGPAIENGTVIITNGKITAVGANVPVPAGAQRIDACLPRRLGWRAPQKGNRIGKPCAVHVQLHAMAPRD